MLDLAELRRAVERDLTALVPGGRVLDADLRVAEAVPIDFALVDAEGRLVLCLLVRGGAEESVFVALDAVSFARRQARSLTRDLFRGEVDEAVRPRVVLLSEHFAERALHRLQPLVQSTQGDLALYELRRVESRRGARVYFVPVEEARRAANEGTSDGEGALEQFVAAVPAAWRPFALDLVGRLGRIDAQLEPSLVSGRLAYALAGRLACELAFTEEGFELVVPGADLVAVRDEESVQTALERVLGRSLELFARPANVVAGATPVATEALAYGTAIARSGEQAEAPEDGAGTAPPFDLDHGELADDDLDGEFGKLMPQSDSGLLSEAEIEAFRHF